MNKRVLFDIETDKIDAEIIRCLCWCDTKEQIIYSTTSYEEMKKFFLQKDVVYIGHNIQLFDLRVAEKLLNIKITAPRWDTLSHSWALFPEREKNSLDSWGETFGIKKPKILDYENQPIEDIIHRCTEDVKINLELWKKIGSYLNQIYEGNHTEIIRYLDYLSLKLEFIREHQELGIKLDVDLCTTSLKELEAIKEEKINALREGMPKKAIKGVKLPPRIMYKKDGTPSENRIKWLKFLEEQGLPSTYNAEVEYIQSYEDGNPSSNAQIKDWLFSLDWKPQHFKYVREEGKKEMRKIPQIKAKDSDDGGVCESIVKLFEKEPSLENLESLSILSHRIGIFKSFLQNQKEGRLYQGVYGYTNTNRLMHSVLVNLPLPYKKYAENIRKCLISDENCILLGTDLASIENKIRDHFIFPHDPDYVNEMNNNKDFDSHLDICVLAGLLTKEEAEQHKKGEKNFKEIRQKGKTVNYAAQYGVGKATLSRNSGLSEKECEKLLKVYWERNWAAKKVAEDCKVKTVNGATWLFNPISKFWYNLRAEKDRLSTLVQGTSAYVFDLFMRNMRQQGLQICGQWHDEALLNIKNDEQIIEEVKIKIQKAIDQINEELKLNVLIQHSIATGFTYKDVH